jgi:hypothetical protein
MDESGPHDTNTSLDILELFSNLVEQPNSKLKVFISSRPYQTIERVLGSHDILLENENFGDIEIMVDAGLSALSKMIGSSETSDDEVIPFAHRHKMSRR